MNYLIKFFPEINLKSASLKRRYIAALQINLHTVLSAIDPAIKVQQEWDRLIIHTAPNADLPALVDAMQRIPGIQKFFAANFLETFDPSMILNAVRRAFGQHLRDKTFAVHVKRTGKHAFSSLELARYIGGALRDEFPTRGVDLENPEVAIRLEINSKNAVVLETEYTGLGGFPIGTQEEVLSLISGGFDSAVASMQLMRRGCKVHFLFFNLGGRQHAAGVQQMAAQLWQRYSASHRVRFIEVDFSQVLANILERIPVGNQGVVLKRSMLRAADRIAQTWDIPAIVTGEALGQVSSQTLTNLNAIDRASETVVLRPLISWDKPDIIDMARRIDVAELAASIPEFCAAISSNPNARVKLSQVEFDEKRLDDDLLQHAVETVRNSDIKELIDSLKGMESFNTTYCQNKLSAASPTTIFDEVIIDVRPNPEYIPLAPQLRKSHQDNIRRIPYYKLLNEFENLDQSKTYLLYCDQGVMSRMQVEHLQARGFRNVKVWSH